MAGTRAHGGPSTNETEHNSRLIATSLHDPAKEHGPELELHVPRLAVPLQNWRWALARMQVSLIVRTAATVSAQEEGGDAPV